MNDRIIELESQIAYLQHQYDGLNQAILRQSDELQQMKKQLAILLRMIDASQSSAAPVDPAEEPPPPHY